jgi:hypothetical protein
MTYALTPEALAFIAAQNPRHITKRARCYVKNFEAAEAQLTLLEHVVALRKRNRMLVWRSFEIGALQRKARKRRAAQRAATLRVAGGPPRAWRRRSVDTEASVSQ